MLRAAQGLAYLHELQVNQQRIWFYNIPFSLSYALTRCMSLDQVIYRDFKS